LRVEAVRDLLEELYDRDMETGYSTALSLILLPTPGALRPRTDWLTCRPGSRRLRREVCVRFSETQYDLCGSRVFDPRHEVRDPLRDCFASLRCHLRW